MHLNLSDQFDIWRAHRQHFKAILPQSRVIKTLWDPMMSNRFVNIWCWMRRVHNPLVPNRSEVSWTNGSLSRYVKLRDPHAPGRPGTLPPPPRASDPDMHHGTCVTHVPWCMPGSLTNDRLWRRWRGKHFRDSRRMRNPQFYVSGKRPMMT